MASGSHQKWQEYAARHRLTPSREATFILTVKNTLEILKDKRAGKALDIGCGFGEIDILLAQATSFNITGCDISEIAIQKAQDNVSQAGLTNRIEIKKGDAHNLEYPDDSFDVVFSFGYVSAATYLSALREVARVLKPNGVLICDFINCLSFYKFLSSFKKIIQKKAPYYISLSGIRREFAKEGLYYIDQRFFNTYPPIDSFNMSSKPYFLFEETLGRVFKKNLGRVRLVMFQKQRSLKGK